MDNTKFSFQISPYDVDKLLPQTSKALEKRTELASRKQYPGLWKFTDKFNTMSHMQKRSRLRTKFMSIICLVLGVFLFVPGIMEPQELLVPLIVGALAIGAGFGGLWRSRKHMCNSFDNSAKLLLKERGTLSPSQSIVISFSKTEMLISVDSKHTERVPYSSFEYVIEAPDIFLMFYDTRVTALQKSDLSDASDAFRDFISGVVPQYQIIT